MLARCRREPSPLRRRSRNASNTAGSQPLVANGLAFTTQGDLLIADTARGAIWKVSFTNSGALASNTGCDTTFTPNTLCLENIFVAHPLLDGADGIALDEAGNIWVSANERNSIAVVSNMACVTEVFRNAAECDYTAAQRGTARKSGEPISVRPHVVYIELRRQPPRQLSQYGRGNHSRLDRTGARSPAWMN